MTSENLRSVVRIGRAHIVVAASLLVLGGGVASCSSDDGGNPDVDPIAWVSPTSDASIAVDETVELTVKVNDESIKLVRFFVDDAAIASCDTTAGPNECRRDSLFRYSTSFHTAGLHRLVASYPAGGGDRSAALTVEVRAASAGPRHDAVVDAGTSPDAGPVTPPPAVDRGFLDPDRASHNVFGGVAWSVGGQHVVVAAPPAGSTTAVAACMKLYGASIIKQADAAKISRGSV
ncbi:MAG: hypothetical protein JWM74_796, partial [Myxococcaceae bacterium]|nr:hypothetical protein [Myxococcaceae bacterium]